MIFNINIQDKWKCKPYTQKISREKMSRQIFHALRDIFFALLFFVFIFEQLLMCVTFFRIFYF